MTKTVKLTCRGHGQTAIFAVPAKSAFRKSEDARKAGWVCKRDLPGFGASVRYQRRHYEQAVRDILAAPAHQHPAMVHRAIEKFKADNPAFRQDYFIAAVTGGEITRRGKSRKYAPRSRKSVRPFKVPSFASSGAEHRQRAKQKVIGLRLTTRMLKRYSRENNCMDAIEAAVEAGYNRGALTAERRGTGKHATRRFKFGKAFNTIYRLTAKAQGACMRWKRNG